MENDVLKSSQIKTSVQPHFRNNTTVPQIPETGRILLPPLAPLHKVESTVHDGSKHDLLQLSRKITFNRDNFRSCNFKPTYVGRNKMAFEVQIMSDAKYIAHLEQLGVK